MSYTIKIGQITKTENDTAYVFTGTGTRVARTISNVELKGGSDLVNPVLEIETALDLEVLQDFNYMEFGNDYYWIDSFEYLYNNYFLIHAHRDPMASFRSAIGNYSAYVTRSNSDGWFNEQLYDNIIAPSSEIVSVIRQSAAAPFALTGGTIVFGFNGSGGNRTGADVTNFYYTTSRPAGEVLGDIFCGNNDIFQTIVQNYQDITRNITMVKAFPFSKGDTSAYSANVYVGQWTQSVSGLTDVKADDFTTSSDGRRWSNTMDIAIPTLYYGDYRDYDGNFVDVSIHLPMIGNIAIPAQFLRGDSFEAVYSVDLLTGVGECTLRMKQVTGTSQAPVIKYKVVGVYNFAAGHDVPVSSFMLEVGSVGSNITHLNPVGAILDHISPPVNCTTVSNVSGLANYFLTEAFLEIKVMGSEKFTYENVKGKKVMAKHTISGARVDGNMGAYIECLNPACKPAGATASEIVTINSYLSSGFYYN